MEIKKSGSGMNIPDHFYERVEAVFWVKKYLKFFVADPDEGLNILISIFCVCAESFQDLSKAFTSF
jgi:hypothetical protein